jgi:hypothetical protein
VATIALALAAPLAAQTTGSIYGTITDSSGAVLPGVAITATNTLTNEARTVHADASGAYTFAQLPIGDYKVRAELDGFTSVSREGIELSLNRNARVDAALKVGAQSETVTVVADAPVVDSRSNEMGAVVDRRRQGRAGLCANVGGPFPGGLQLPLQQRPRGVTVPRRNRFGLRVRLADPFCLAGRCDDDLILLCVDGSCRQHQPGQNHIHIFAQNRCGAGSIRIFIQADCQHQPDVKPAHPLQFPAERHAVEFIGYAGGFRR